jgi:hypothetical protein
LENSKKKLIVRPNFKYIFIFALSTDEHSFTITATNTLSFKAEHCRPQKDKLLVDTPIIPALWRLRKEDCKFKVSLGYLLSSMPT